MPPAFLAVFSEPGSLVTLTEFHDWYDTEHIPLRMNHLPSFLSSARFQASNTLPNPSPSWLALYDIADTSTFQDSSYTQLRSNRSEREATLVSRLEMLDRRCCQVMWDSGVVPETVSTSLGVGNPTGVVVTHGLEGAEGDTMSQVKVITDGLRGEQGWIRTRLFKCIDALKTGTSIPMGPEAQKVPPFLVLHEFLTQDAADRLILQGQQIEQRKWELYRAYPNLAHS